MKFCSGHSGFIALAFALTSVAGCSNYQDTVAGFQAETAPVKPAKKAPEEETQDQDEDAEQAPPPAPPAPPAPPPPAGAKLATGRTTIAFTPRRYQGATYAAFVYAVWVTDSSNRYVKTISARAATRMRYLDKWLASAGVVAPTQPDGIAGATLAYPAAAAPISVTWDMKGKAGAPLAEGNYNINFQMTSSNNTGVSLVVPVSISSTGAAKTDATQTTGITTVSINHAP